MTRFLRNAVIGSSLFLLGTAVNARVHKERGEYNQQQFSVVDQVRTDLKGVMNMGSLSGSQRGVHAFNRSNHSGRGVPFQIPLAGPLAHAIDESRIVQKAAECPHQRIDV